MNFISYSDCPISINGENFYATSATLQAKASINAGRVMGGGLESYRSTAPLVSSLSLDYYVTGSNERVLSLTGAMPCSGSFGGIAFSGAYLSQYSTSIRPYRPMVVSSSFEIFSGCSHTLKKGSFTSISGIDVANGASTDLINFNYNNLGMDNPIDIKYSINCERTPNYTIGSEFPKSVALGQVEKNMTIAGENIGGLISYSGSGIAEISITPKTINNMSRGQTLVCAGVINSQELSVDADGLVNGNIGIFENIR